MRDGLRGGAASPEGPPEGGLSPRPAPTWLLATLFASVVWCSILVNQWWLARQDLWEPLRVQTGGLVHPTLIGGLFCGAFEVGLVVLLLGRYRPSEIGFVLKKLPAGALATALVWIVVQTAAVLLAVASGDPLALDAQWGSKGLGSQLGPLLAQLLGNAFSEELLFRGFLLGQCILFTRARTKNERHALFRGALLCALLFALTHVPNRLMKERYVSIGAVLLDQGLLIFWGLAFAWLYLRTQNLFFLIGVHSLGNRPTLLVGMPEAQGLVLLVAAVLAWHWKRLPGAVPGEKTGIALDPEPSPSRRR